MPARVSRRALCVFVISLVFMMCSDIGVAQSGPVTPFVNGVDLAADMDYIEDPCGELSIEDVVERSSEWKKNRGESINFGYSMSAYWFRAGVKNTEGSALNTLLEIDFPTLDHIELYTPDREGGFLALHTGDLESFDKRPIRDPNFLFPLTLEPGVTSVYLRVASSGSIRFNARIFTERGYVEYQNRILPFVWLLYGMMALIAVFYFFLFALLRNRFYIYFALLTSFLLVFQISHRGYASQFLWPDYPRWANISLPMMLNLMGVFAALFLMVAMRTRKAAPRMDTVFRIFAYVLFPIGAVLSFLLPLTLSLKTGYALAFVFIIVVVSYTIAALRAGNRFARYFTVGVAWAAFFAIMGMLTTFGLLPLSYLTKWSTEIGFLLFVLATTGGTISRIKYLNDGLRKSHDEHLKNIDLLTRANQELSATNEELNATMEELGATNEEFEAQNEELIVAQEELRRSEEKYRSLIENIDEVVYTIDPEGKITYISPSIEKISGFTPENFTGEPFLSYIHPDDRDEIIMRFGELAQGAIKPSIYRIGTIDKGYRWITSTSRPIFRNGRFVGAGGVLADIHEWKVAEDRASLEKSFASTIIDTLPGIFFVLDGQGKLVRWKGRNKGVDAFGYSQAEVHTMNALQMVAPNDRDLAEKLIRKARKGHGFGEITIKRKDGEAQIFHIAVSSVRLGEEDSIIGIGFEITELKRAEEEREKARIQLLQAQKMEAIGVLAGGIAHDFNNMLMGIMGSLDLIRILLNNEGRVDRSSMLNYIELAYESSKRSAEMTRRLLALSRKSGMQAIVMDINDTISTVHRFCKNALPKSVELDFRVYPEPLRVKAEPVQIEQALLNLCVNASHAMTMMRAPNEREGGTLTVEASVVRPTNAFISRYPLSRRAEVYVKLMVEDTGVGIPDEDLGQIFDPFFTTKKKEEGTGLGLAMVYSIVNQYEGFVDVASTLNQGSIFSIYLPMLYQKENGEHKDSDLDKPMEGEGRILLVDDEKSVLLIGKGLLEQLGYKVMAVRDPFEALELFKKENGAFDVAVLDLSMPGMSGLETFEKMREIDPNIQAVLVSGYIEDDLLSDVMESGIVGFIRKPYTITELSMQVKKAINRSKEKH